MSGKSGSLLFMKEVMPWAHSPEAMSSAAFSLSKSNASMRPFPWEPRITARAARTALGPFFEMTSAIAIASARTFPGSLTFVAKPTRRASSAESFLPVRMMSAAAPVPTSLVRATPDSKWAWDEVNADDDPEPQEFIEECELENDWVNYGDDLVHNPEYLEWMVHRLRRAKWITFRYSIDWVIAGGESGPDARPCHPDWLRDIRDLCVECEIPFFFKQWGEWLPWIPAEGNPTGIPPQHVMLDGTAYYPGNPAPLQSMIRVGRKAAGHMLDGQEWQQFPEWE